MEPISKRSELGEFLFRNGWWLTLLFFAAYLFSFSLRPLPSFSNASNPDLVIRRALFFFLSITTEFEVYWQGWSDGSSLLKLISNRAPFFLTAIIVSAMAWVPGRLMIRAAECCGQFNRLETLSYSLVFGWQMNSVVVLCLGLCGQLNLVGVVSGSFLLVLILLVWIGVRNLFFARRAEACKIPSGEMEEHYHNSERLEEGQGTRIDRRFDRLLRSISILALVFFAGIIFLGAMLPSTDFDVLEYHLQVPKEWYQQGQIEAVPHNVYGNMPLGAEVHTIPATIILQQWDAGSELPVWWSGAMAGKTVMGIQALITALLIISAVCRYRGLTAGLFAGAVYLSTPWVIRAAFVGWNENALGLYSLSTYLLLFQWSRNKPRSVGLLLLLGVAVGGAISVKYTGVLFVLLPTVIWILFGDWVVARWFDRAGKLSPMQLTSQAIRELLKRGAVAMTILLGSTLVFGGSWYLKNAYFFGNPTYPLLGGLFGSRTEVLNEQWDLAHGVPVNGFSPSRLLADLDLLLVGSEWLSPILIPFGVLGILQRRRTPFVWGLAGLILFGLLAWLAVTHRIDRFLVPLIPLLAILAGFAAVRQPAIWWRAFCCVSLLLASWYGAVLAVSPTGALGESRFLVSNDTLRNPRSVIQRVHQELNRRVPEGSYVLLVGDAIPFDLECKAQYNTCFDPVIWEQLVEEKIGEEVRQKLVQGKVSHVFVDWGEIERYRNTYGFHSDISKADVNQLVRMKILEPIPIELPPNRGQLFKVVLAD